MNRIFWDIETSPNVVTSFRIGRKVFIPYDSILQERKIISVAWKWEDESKIHALTWDEDQDDLELLIQFNEVLNSCDEAVAHFGDGFDLPWFRARCMIQGVHTNHLIKTVDTCKLAGKFYFNSKKLDYLAQILEVGEKITTGKELWNAVVNQNDRTALKKMVAYNKQDVLILEGVYHKLAAAMPAKTHVGVLQGLPKWTCPKNGSQNVKKSKTRVTAGGSVQHQMQCLDCGSYWSINNSEFEKYLNGLE